jgi:hypothetical protein
MQEQLELKLQALLHMPPLSDGVLPFDMPKNGVYVFTELGRHLYVGQSANLRIRYGQHCFAGAWHRHASFAICLARAWIGDEVAYKLPRSHDTPILDHKSAKAFSAAKARIRAMDFRFVEEPDSRRRSLLELYCSVALQVPFGDFENYAPIAMRSSLQSAERRITNAKISRTNRCAG